MLDAFYRQIFRPSEDESPSIEVSLLIAGLTLLVMTLNASSRLQLPAGAISLLLILFALGGVLGLFWFTAALYALTSLLRRDDDFQMLLLAVLSGLWPLMFSGAALSAQRLSAGFGALFSIAVTLGTVVTLTRSLARVQSFRPWQSFLFLIVAMLLSMGAVSVSYTHLTLPTILLV